MIGWQIDINCTRNVRVKAASVLFTSSCQGGMTQVANRDRLNLKKQNDQFTLNSTS
jgi:uncharacterized protein (DUF2345 family)